LNRLVITFVAQLLQNYMYILLGDPGFKIYCHLRPHLDVLDEEVIAGD